MSNLQEQDLAKILDEKYNVRRVTEDFFNHFKKMADYMDSKMIQIYDPAEDSHTPLDKLILRALDMDIKKRQDIEKGWKSTMKLAVDFDDVEIVKKLMSYREACLKFLLEI